MDGPERLEDDARPARRGTTALVAVTVLVLAGLGAARFGGLLPDPAPEPPRSGPSATHPPTRWPSTAAPGTLYVLDASGVVSVDTVSGLVQHAPVKVDPSSVALTAGGFGVLLWFVDANGTPRLVTPGAPSSPTVTGVLARGRQFLAGPGAAVWTSPDDPFVDVARRTWRLVDVDGSVLSTVRLPGSVESDGSGGLFESDERRVRHVVAGQPTTVWTGKVTATGPDGYEAVRCTGRRCDHVLHDRATGTETTLATPPADAFAVALSPGNRFVASLEPESTSDDSPDVVRVSVPGVKREIRSFSASEDGATSFGWLSDRWLAAVGDEGLVLYDAVEDQVVTPDLGLASPTQLVFRPT